MIGKIVWVLIAVALGYYLIWSFHASDSQDHRFNNWTSRCHNDGGLVQQTWKSFWTTNYECFKDGKIIDHEN